jgi:hypothetical protein
MRTRPAGTPHKTCGFIGQFGEFMPIQPIFDAKGRGSTGLYSLVVSIFDSGTIGQSGILE